MQRRIPSSPSRRTVAALWVFALLPLLAALGIPAVERAREAEVFESARQMIGTGINGWLIPVVNGEVRLRQPPMATWLAAGAFNLFGVGGFAGRLPSAICSWLSLAVTYSIASRLFGRRVGLMSAAFLLASYLFFHQGRSAETDAPAMLLTTLAVDLFWRSLDGDSPLLFHVAAAATGLAIFIGGGIGSFAILFFVAMTIIRRQPATLRRFVLCGAPVTLVVIGGWWYVYAIADQGLARFRLEWTAGPGGPTPFAWFLGYFPMLLLGSAPWSLLTVAGLLAAAGNCRRDPRLLGLLVWLAACFVPLCLLGTGQDHDLLPLMPPLMIVTAWFVEAAAATKPARILTGITIAGAILAPLLALWTGDDSRGHLIPLDVAIAGGVMSVSLPAWLMYRRAGVSAGLSALAGTWGLVMAMVVGVWMPTISTTSINLTARQISRDYDPGPYVFYGGEASLPLCFAMGREIRRMDDARPDLLVAAFREQPDLTVICRVPEEEGEGSHTPPPPFKAGGDFGSGGQRFRIYKVAGWGG